MLTLSLFIRPLVAATESELAIDECLIITCITPFPVHEQYQDPLLLSTPCHAIHIALDVLYVTA